VIARILSWLIRPDPTALVNAYATHRNPPEIAFPHLLLERSERSDPERPATRRSNAYRPDLHRWRSAARLVDPRKGFVFAVTAHHGEAVNRRPKWRCIGRHQVRARGECIKDAPSLFSLASRASRTNLGEDAWLTRRAPLSVRPVSRSFAALSAHPASARRPEHRGTFLDQLTGACSQLAG
jgi:hypothetical protein